MSQYHNNKVNMNYRTCSRYTNNFALSTVTIITLSLGLFSPPHAWAQMNSSVTYSLGVGCLTAAYGYETKPNTTPPALENVEASDEWSSATYDTGSSYGVLQVAATCAANTGPAGVFSDAYFCPASDGFVVPTVGFMDTLTITSATLSAGTPVQVQVTCVNTGSVSQSFSGNTALGDVAKYSNVEVLAITNAAGTHGSSSSVGVGQFADGANGNSNINNSVSILVTQYMVGTSFRIYNGIFAFGTNYINIGDAAAASISENLTSVTYVDLLTPGASYTAASGTVYPTMGPNIQATSNNSLVISWPAVWTNVVLEQIETLGSTNWTLNTNAVSMVNGSNQAVISPTDNSMFFRLAQH